MRLSPVLLAVICPAAVLTAADDDAIIVVTADRLPEREATSIHTLDLIDEADRRAAGRPYQPIELVAELPGSFLLRNGGVSGVSSLRLRGAPSYGTLILHDGVPLHDAAGTQSAPDLTVLNPAGIARAEVLRGPQSGLYGSRAIGGVVNFRPLSASAEHELRGHLQGGSFATVDALAQATGPIGETSGYAAGLSATASEGISNKTSDGNGDPGEHEEDSFERYGGYGRLEYRPVPGLLLFGSVDSVSSETEFDAFTDPDDDSLFTDYAVHRVHAGARLDDGAHDRYHLAADLAYSIYEREQPNASFGSKAWTGHELYASLHGDYQLLPLLNVSGGADLRFDEAETELVGGGSSLDDDASHIGLWLRGEAARDRWAAAATLRQEYHSEEADATTWQLSAHWDPLQERVRLHAMIGSSFRAPSLFEQFSQDDFGSGPIGDSDLEAEEGLGFAIGHRSRLGERVVVANTVFSTRFDQRIDFVFGSGYSNFDGNERIDGVESEVLIEHSDEVPVDLSVRYTWQSFDHAHGLERRLPENLLRNAITWHAAHDVLVRLTVTAVDDRSDGSATLAAYTLIDAAASWRIDERWTLFARGENLSDEDYELVDDFATPGIALYLGGSGRF